MACAHARSSVFSLPSSSGSTKVSMSVTSPRADWASRAVLSSKELLS
jgi:hypothetical protein